MTNRFIKMLAVVLGMAGLFGLTTRAEVLMSDGAPIGDTGYSAASGGTGTLNQTVTTNAVFGFASQKWQNSTGVVYVFPETDGLALPASFPSAAVGGSFGLLRNETGADGVRCQWKSLTDGLVASQSKVYFRMLMNVSSVAITALRSGSRYGAGLGATGNAVNEGLTKDTGLFFSVVNSGGTCSLVARLCGTDYTLVSPVAADTTYLCVAEITVGTGTDGKEQVRVFAMPVADWQGVEAYAADIGTDGVIEGELAGGANPIANLLYGGQYQTSNGQVRFDEFMLGTAITDVVALDANAPALSAATVAPGEGGAFSLSVTVKQGTGALLALADDGTGTVLTNEVSGSVSAGEVSGAIPGLATNTTYAVTALMTNETASASREAGTIWTGELALSLVSDASESYLTPGTVTVSRASASALPLTLNYVFTGGTALAGTNYVAPAGVVTIPAGAASAVIEVVPLMDSEKDVATTLNVALLPGNYCGAGATVTVSIANWTAPAGYNCWVAGNSSDGLASTAANWSDGVPTADDHILLGLFSTHDMTWDGATAGMPASVASWEQQAGYTGTNTFLTTFTGAFTNFTVTGDVAIHGGTWTHPANADTQVYHLAVTVGGDFTLDAGTALDARFKGLANSKTFSGGGFGIHAGGNTAGSLEKVRGNVYEPVDVGSGGNAWGKSNFGGGAIWLDVGGAAVLNGLVDVHALEQNSGWGANGSGAPGSFFIRAQSVSGSGSILANAPKYDRRGSETPSGGRVGIVLTQATELGFPVANIALEGAFSSSSAGGGTLFVKTASQTHGTLYIKNRAKAIVDTCGITLPEITGVTPIVAGETWTFDAVRLIGAGVLAIPTNTTLALPNGWQSVSADSERCGVVYMGGTVEVPEGDQVIASNWVFQADAPYTFAGNVTVKDDGRIGVLRFRCLTNQYSVCRVTVAGNLTVETSGWIWARGGGLTESVNYESSDAYRFNGFFSHGGQTARVPGANECYDSVFNPALPGSFGTGNDGQTETFGGGVVALTVTGNLVMDGEAVADATGTDNKSNYYSMGAGGTLNITAGTLSGRGKISADGFERAVSANYTNQVVSSACRGWTACAGGGRVAVRLTAPGADFAAFGASNITALGAAKASDNTNGYAGAGTVYLQAAGQAEGAGTIIVRNTGSAINTTGITALPAGVAGDTAASYAAASLSIEACGRVTLFDSLAMKAVAMESGTALDLNGQDIVVKSLSLNGGKVGSGTYTAADAAVSGYVADSAGGGTLTVRGTGFVISIR